MIGNGGSADISVIEAEISDINSLLTVVDGNVDDIETLSNTIDGKIDIIDGNVDDIEAVLGKKTDYVSVPYEKNVSPAMAYLKTAYYHEHGASFIYPYKAAPVLLTSSAAAWSETGDIIEIIPAGAIGKDFDLHWCSLWDISNALYGIIDLFGGPPEDLFFVGPVEVGRTVNFSRENSAPIQMLPVPAGTRISGRFVDDTTSIRTVRIKVYGHVYDTIL
jgi:hypothetical protein